MKAIYMTAHGEDAIRQAYGENTRAQLAQMMDWAGGIYSRSELISCRDALQDVEAIFSTWGMLPLSKEEIQEYLPRLRAVFYAAGSVQAFARPFLECGVTITSAFAANAVPVAEYAAAQILLAGKGFYQSCSIYGRFGFQQALDFANGPSGNFRTRVGLLGAGAIGKLVIEKLRATDLEILVFDPFLPEETAAQLGVCKSDLKTIFSTCQVISNHLANNEATRGMLDYSLFSAMGPYATFLNTGRGAQVVEPDLVRALHEAPTRTAVLDVTCPEPVAAGHAFYAMENVFLTPHIAGSKASEVARMGEYMLQEARSYLAGEPLRWQVTMDMLASMA